MFGLSENNDNKYADTTQASASDADSKQPAQPNPASSSDPNATVPMTGYAPAMPPASASSQPSASNPPAHTTPSGGMGDVSLDNAYIDSPAPTPTSKDSSDQSRPSAASLVNNSNEDELLKLKQQALQNLAPLVDHLDQDPEAKFKTTMMMIQASDNADLIPDAYEAANKIQDEKIRAQALLDVVNEINYFTQHSSGA
jgi:hypothetical protein